MALNILTRAIREAVPDAELRPFQTVADALNELRDNGFQPDLAFLDIEMPGMNGLELAKEIKGFVPRVNIVFVTGYSQYAFDAISIRSSGYVMKPVDKNQILVELHNLRNPPVQRAPQKRVRIQCFGDFEIFADGQVVAFPRAKSKELLAYLVDRRGASCPSGKIAEALWEDGYYDRARQKLFSTIRADMLKALRQVGAEGIVKKTNNLLASSQRPWTATTIWRWRATSSASIVTWASIWPRIHGRSSQRLRSPQASFPRRTSENNFFQSPDISGLFLWTFCGHLPLCLGCKKGPTADGGE